MRTAARASTQVRGGKSSGARGQTRTTLLCHTRNFPNSPTPPPSKKSKTKPHLGDFATAGEPRETDPESYTHTQSMVLLVVFDFRF